VVRVSRPPPQPPLTAAGIEAYAGVLQANDTIALTSRSPVAIQGNFRGPNVVIGRRYSIVLLTELEPKVLAEVTAQDISYERKFSATIWLSPGTYSIGDHGNSGNIFAVDADNQSVNAQGARDVTSTLRFGIDGLFDLQDSQTRAER
jgi:hypothetical protein